MSSTLVRPKKAVPFCRSAAAVRFLGEKLFDERVNIISDPVEKNARDRAVYGRRPAALA